MSTKHTAFSFLYSHDTGLSESVLSRTCISRFLTKLPNTCNETHSVSSMYSIIMISQQLECKYCYTTKQHLIYIIMNSLLFSTCGWHRSRFAKTTVKQRLCQQFQLKAITCQTHTVQGFR